MSALKEQVGGDHYKNLAIQPMEYSMANKLDACQHTVVKYVTRFREKGGIQDLEKAKHVIDLLIEFERKAETAAMLAPLENWNKPAHANDNAEPPVFPVNRLGELNEKTLKLLARHVNAELMRAEADASIGKPRL